jgi:hypothetical protein
LFISAGIAWLYCSAPFPPMPGIRISAAIPGSTVISGTKAFGYAPMIGVSRPARMSFAAMARCTSAKFVAQ